MSLPHKGFSCRVHAVLSSLFFSPALFYVPQNVFGNILTPHILKLQTVQHVTANIWVWYKWNCHSRCSSCSWDIQPLSSALFEIQFSLLWNSNVTVLRIEWLCASLRLTKMNWDESLVDFPSGLKLTSFSSYECIYLHACSNLFQIGKTRGELKVMRCSYWFFSVTIFALVVKV